MSSKRKRRSAAAKLERKRDALIEEARAHGRKLRAGGFRPVPDAWASAVIEAGLGALHETRFIDALPLGQREPRIDQACWVREEDYAAARTLGLLSSEEETRIQKIVEDTVVKFRTGEWWRTI